MPYGTSGLVFKEGNESTDIQEAYYKYMNKYVKENHIPGMYFEDDSKILEKLDEITETLSKIMKETVYIDQGTQVLGDVSESDYISIEMDEPETKPRKRNG